MNPSIKSPSKILARTIQHLREKMGLSVIDLQWLTGSMTRKWAVDDTSEVPDPSLSILIRYLNKHPEENPLPQIPSVEEIEMLVETYWDRGRDRKFCTKRLGPLFGCSPIAGYKWSTDAEPSQTISHMMLILKRAIEKDGRAGFERYLAVVKEEAMVRGVSVEELWDEGWKMNVRRERANKENQEKIQKHSVGQLDAFQ